MKIGDISMKHKEFYKLLDSELNLFIEDFSDEMHSKLREDHQKRSYAFMLWFLKFYSGLQNIGEMITDGHGDNSCDIILDKRNSQGDNVFYLVQSKWNKEHNCNSHFESETLKSFLSDAQSILRGDKEETENQIFNKRYKALLEHVRSNGEVKVIYLTLKNNCKTFLENITSFENSFGANVKVDAFDINRLKLDYIDRRFKKNNPPNPLEKIYSPEYEKIKLELVKDNEKNAIQISTPHQGLVFNLKPSTIYKLVERYGVSLFNKNVRNPLLSSNINDEIVTTLKNDPSYFWYYNNGITAITRHIPQVSSQAENFDVKGLQVINGAQTAYSIHKAYSESNLEERNIIDEEARVTFRLLKSGGSNFDLKVTKYTNSQNPVSERDFCSSDPIQLAIQDYFYNTNFWYECRRGEFRAIPEGTEKIENTVVANAYLAFHLSDPVSIIEAAIEREQSGSDKIFTSHKDHTDGLYEKIFNKDTTPEAMYASFCMFYILQEGSPIDPKRAIFSNAYHILAIVKVVLNKYLQTKFNDNVNLYSYIIKKFTSNDQLLFKQCVVKSMKILKEDVTKLAASQSQAEGEGEGEGDIDNVIFDIMLKKSHFDMLLDRVSKLQIDVDEIEAIELHDNDSEDENEDSDDKEKESLTISSLELH
ncbi:hypothetical protein CWN87_08665 [Vibrio splendidus]|nr:hypothetical protein CWN87_08665 [Vibrio splendidus]